MCSRQSRKVVWDMINTLFSINHRSCRTYFRCFPLAIADICPWPPVPFFQLSLKNKRTQNHPQHLSGCRLQFFTATTFLEIAVLACEQALCLGKKIARKGKGRGERACRQTFEAAIPPSCNYLAEHLSVRSLSVNPFRS